MNNTDMPYGNDSTKMQVMYDQIKSIANNESILKWDVGASTSIDTSVQVDKGEAKQLKGSQRQALTIRVWNKKGLIGITNTSDFTKDGLKKALLGAQKASEFGNKNETPEFSPLCKEEIDELNRPLSINGDIQDLFNSLKIAESDLLDRHEDIKAIPYNGIAESLSERFYFNCESAFRYTKISQSSIYLYAMAQQENRKPRSAGSVRISNCFDDLDINGCINEAAEKTIAHLNYQNISTDKYLVCFTPEAFLDLIGAFSTMFNARSVLDGVSISKKESIGKQIAVPFLSIFDNGLHPSNIGACPFDGEGTPTKKICLLRNGILENFLHSEATARSFGVLPTGHAGIGAKVSVGPDWLDVRGDNNSPQNKESLSYKDSTRDFVLIEGLNALHAGVKPSQGSFSLPFDGWIVRNGEKISIEAATIAGDINQVLNSIIKVEAEQIITTQGISPHIWVEDLKITGEA